MPGWMGLRGVKPNNPLEQERKRRESQRLSAQAHDTQILRAQEKVQEVLRQQDGEMSPDTGKIDPEERLDYEQVAARPVREIMSSRLAVLAFDDNLFAIQGIFASVSFHHLPVVDEKGEIIGIISDRDFLRVVSPFFGTINEQNRDKEIMNRKAGMIMTRNPICVEENGSIITAVKVMNQRKISCLPVVSPGTVRLVGIVTWKDVVRAFCPQAFSPSRSSTRIRARTDLDAVKAVSPLPPARTGEEAPTPESPADLSPAVKPAAPAADAVLPGSDGLDHANPGNHHDTHPIYLTHPTPHIAAQEKLTPSNFGHAGSDLASRQLARMREQYGGKGKESE